MTDGEDKEWERMKPRANKIRLMVTRGGKEKRENGRLIVAPDETK